MDSLLAKTERTAVQHGWSRRRWCSGLVGLCTVAALPGGLLTAPRALAAFDKSDPRENVRAFARLVSDLGPEGGVGRTYYQGRAFAVLPGGETHRLYDLHGLGSIRAELEPDGACRLMFSEFAIYTNPGGVQPLETLNNPVTGRDVAVWHQRNGPVNFRITPDMPAFGAFEMADQSKGFVLPWEPMGDTVRLTLDVVSDRANPLAPETWPLESSGERLRSSEHSQYFIDAGQLEDPEVTSLRFNAALQSLKPWHPWMMMGQRPGRVYTRMTSRKVRGLDELPGPVADHARRHLADYLEPAETWAPAYRTAHQIYRETHEPAQAGAGTETTHNQGGDARVRENST